MPRAMPTTTITTLRYAALHYTTLLHYYYFYYYYTTTAAAPTITTITIPQRVSYNVHQYIGPTIKELQYSPAYYFLPIKSYL